MLGFATPSIERGFTTVLLSLIALIRCEVESMYKTPEFADAYSAEKDSHPFRIQMERHTILNLIKRLSGISVLDMACGAGNYSRLFCYHGAKKVVGVDCSAAMINSARQSTASGLPITYVKELGENFRDVEGFDLVFHSYYLNYADSLEALNKMCRSLYGNLSDGGSMVGITCVLGQSPGGALTCCDFYTAFEERPEEGQAYKIFFRGQNEHIVNFNWNQQTYNTCLYNNGFRNIEWHSPVNSDSAGLTKDQWEELHKFPVFLAVTANK